MQAVPAFHKQTRPFHSSSVTHGLVSPFLLLSFPTPATATVVAVPERNELSSLSSYTSCRRCHGRWSFSASLPLSLSLPLLVGHVCFGRMPSDSLPISLSLSLSRSLLFRSLPLRGPSINDVYTGRGSGEWGSPKAGSNPVSTPVTRGGGPKSIRFCIRHL